MILCVATNPAIDRTLTVPHFQPAEVNRATDTLVAADGKGINVARVIHTLGGVAICAGPLGGHTGRLVAELAMREGLRGAWTWIDGETRTCLIIVDTLSREATVINELGPAVTPEEWDRLADQIVSTAAEVQCVCLSGSLPPTVSPDVYAKLLRRLCDTGKPVWVDTSGPSLAAALTVRGVSIKVNDAEAGAVLGMTVQRPETALAAARMMYQRTGSPAIVTLGADGALLADAQGSWLARPPALEIVSAVGSGDAFLGALALALVRGLPLSAALHHGVAAGAANALAVGGGFLQLAEFQRLLECTSVHAVA